MPVLRLEAEASSQESIRHLLKVASEAWSGDVHYLESMTLKQASSWLNQSQLALGNSHSGYHIFLGAQIQPYGSVVRG